MDESTTGYQEAPDSAEPLHGHQGRSGTREARLYTNVFRTVVIVDKQVVYLADLVAVAVVDLVARILVFDLRSPVAMSFVFDLTPPYKWLLPTRNRRWPGLSSPGHLLLLQDRRAYERWRAVGLFSPSAEEPVVTSLLRL
jgi:hypothetical protein